VLLSADYSQIELRIPRICPATRRSSKRSSAAGHPRAHGGARAELLPNMVTPELRNQAKVINYGLNYGMGASRLAAETGLTPRGQSSSSYFRALPRVKRYLDGSLQRARTDRRSGRFSGGGDRARYRLDQRDVARRGREHGRQRRSGRGSRHQQARDAQRTRRSPRYARGSCCRCTTSSCSVPDDELTEVSGSCAMR
jgi:hypothetical protein